MRSSLGPKCLIASVAAACLLMPRASTAAVQKPDLLPEQGAALTVLARDAMDTYLANRTPADQLEIPEALRGIVSDGRAGWGAVVTLRYEGKVVASVSRREENLARSVAAAAQRAMRSEHLPDRIDSGVLSQVTVEVEVMGQPVPVEIDAFAKSNTRGLLGLLLKRGPSIAYVLPSTAILQDLSPPNMVRRCRLDLPTSKTVLAARPQWSLFATRHFVSAPGRPAVELFRGKVLTDSPADAAEAASAGATVAQFLAAHQKPDGRYSGPGWQDDLVTHILTTRAMALAASREHTPAIVASVNSAMTAIARSIQQTPKTAIVQTSQPENRLAATALAVLTIDRLDSNAAIRTLRGKLVAAIVTAADNPTHLPPPTLETGGDPAALTPRDLAFTVLALADADPAAATADAMRKTLLKKAQEDPTAAPWAVFAGLLPRSSGPELIGEDDPVADRRGGVALPGREPTVMLTSLCVTGRARVDARVLGQARRFCLNNLYKDGDLYPPTDPGDYRGSLRVSPAESASSARACAAGIEVLLGTGTVIGP